MLKKPLLLLPLVAALSTLSLPSLAAEYHFRVPVLGVASQDEAIRVHLDAADLPTGLVGDPFVGFDFNTALSITGDPELDMSQVAWSVYSGALPEGLLLTRQGLLIGVPSQAGSRTARILAKYMNRPGAVHKAII